MKTMSNIKPQKLAISRIGKHYEIIYSNNIQEINVDGETHYEYDMKLIKAKINSRDEAIEIFVALEYSTGAEISLIKKGMLDSNNQEYLNYLDYVQWCKEQSYIWFGE